MQIRTALRFLAVPLRTAPLLVLVTFGVLLFLALKASLFGIPLGLLLLTGFANYTFVLLDSVLHGDKEPPVLAIEMMNPVNAPRSLLLLALVIIVFFASQAASYWFGTATATVMAIACAALLPALLAVQAVTGVTFQALNVATALRLMARLGGDYVFIVAFVIAAVPLGSYVLALTPLPLPLRIAVVLYLWLASFCLLGGVLRERSQDIGLDDAWTPETLESDGLAAEEREHAQLHDRLYAEWRGGAHANAWQSVLAHVAQSSDALHELQWLYERTARWPDARLAQRLAREILPHLLAAKRNGEAIDLVRVRLRVDPNFRPLTSSDLLQLAALLRDAGDRPTARALLHDFERLFPNDPAQNAAAQLTTQLER